MPSPQVIKKRIEGLIEREYLARTPEDRLVAFSKRTLCKLRLRRRVEAQLSQKYPQEESKIPV